MSTKNIEDIYSLSPIQHGMLFHSISHRHEDLYAKQLSCTIVGALNVAAFREAWQQAIDRHEILRASYQWETREGALQIIHTRARLPFGHQDLRSLPSAERERKVAEFLATDQRLGFDLSKAPLMRVTLLELTADTFRLVWDFHHLILDGWSAPLLVKEVFALYQAARAGRRPVLDAVRPYGDYIQWLERQDKPKAEAFWKRTLEGFSAPTAFRVDYAGIAAPSSESAYGDYDEKRLVLDETVTTSLLAFARQNELTLNTLVQGAWALLLSRYSGEEDVVFGATVSGRSAGAPGIESMIGVFINTLPVRTRVSPDRTVASWLKELQRTHAEIREYEHSPLVDIQGFSDVARGRPMFESIIVFENYPIEKSTVGPETGLSIRDLVTNVRNNYPITVLAVPGKGLSARFAYDLRRFDGATMDRMLGHFAALIEGLAVDPDRRLGDVPMLSPAERLQLLVEWNDTAVELPRDAGVHAIFEAQVSRTPAAPALSCRGETLSYEELNQRANQLAWHLRARGVGPDVVVGLCVEPSLEMVIGLLGVLKAGGAYLPLDPTYPAERLAQMIREARVPLLLAQERFASVLPVDREQVLCLDADRDKVAVESGENLRGGAREGNLAYVLFTSGSTGLPKGVAIEHRQLVNYVRAVTERLRPEPGFRHALVSTFSADLGNTVLFPSLCTGGCLHVMSRDAVTDPDRFAAYFADHRIDCLKIVPSHLAALLTSSRAGSALPKRRLVLGGEASSWELIRKVEELAPECVVLNHYGPTETTVGAVTFPVERGVREPGASIVPLGRPLANLRVYLLDERLGPVPVGVPGEVYIGGAGVARGYLHRPELTAERFVPDPFHEGDGGAAGARLYRTGDLARYLPSGNLLFLGRLDHQVKIRGFRIELTEIEASLQRHPAVRSAIALVREDATGKRIAAYVVPSAGSPSLAELRSFLAERLPDYMVPATFELLEELPLTPNGKVDRAALLSLGEKPEEPKDDHALRNPIEEVVAGIWADVLGVERVGIDDDFAALGGHSLTAIQVIARTREAFQADVPLRAIFDSPTVATFSAAVDKAVREGLGIEAPPLVRARRDQPLDLSFGQEGLWFLDRLRPNTAAFLLARAIRLHGALDVAAMEGAITEVIARHEILRTTFSDADGQPRQIIHAPTPFQLPVIDLSVLPEMAREAAAIKEAGEAATLPFDLEKGPLVRAKLLRLAEQDHVLLFTLHHIVSDAWTNGILVAEVGAIYNARRRGEPSGLSDLPIQYADYAAWQRTCFQGEVLEKQLAYWREHLAGAPSHLDLPTDRPRPPVLTANGGEVRFELTPAVTKGLNDLSRRSGATLFMVLLAAYDVLLSRYSGQEDLVVGTAIAGRTHKETEGLIGFFVNLLALRTDLSGEPSFAELLVRVREVTLGAYTHQEMPFARLVEELAQDAQRSQVQSSGHRLPRPALRDLARSPVFQAALFLQNTPLTGLRLEGLELRALPEGKPTANHDLQFYFAEGAQKLVGSVVYNSDLFDAATVARMVRHLESLLGGAVEDAEQRIWQLPMLSDEELRQLLVTWNSTGAALPEGVCLHQLFEAQAARSPEAIAVVFDGSTLSYGELDRRSNQLAHALRAQSVGPDTRVAVCMDRSLELLVALLGVLKAGGAYVPVDPTYPKERIAFFLADARAPVLLTQPHLLPDLPPHGAGVICLDASFATVASERTAALPSFVRQANLAYMIYTSGSTGRPKGAMNTHGAIVNRLLWMQRTYRLTEADRVLQKTPFSFDVSVWELFWPLLNGARLVVARTGGHRDGAYLTDLVAAQGITVIHFVPSMLDVFLKEPDLARCRSLRLVVCSGEALAPSLQQRFFERFDTATLHNLYGPTEAAIDVTSWACERQGGVRTVPIGRPVDNTQIYVLDRHFSPVPIGVAGELFIGGVQLARGYLDRPDLTAATFLPDPFAREAADGGGSAAALPGARLYRTGDLARVRADGAIEYLARLDHQVKIRGFRIELGEIEAALGQQPSVREVVVLAREDTPGDQRLVAYLVLADGLAPSASDLRAALGARLPEYMIPSAFVSLESLPLTVNGKVDRKALMPPDETGSSESYVAPRSPIEEVLAGIWADVLKMERVGVGDDFFDLGGHSLLVGQVLARVRELFHVEFPVLEFFTGPTIGQLAVRIQASLRVGDTVTAAPILRVPRGGELPLSFQQERLWFLDQLEPDSSFYNIPAAVRLDGALDVPALGAALEEIVRRHEILRTSFPTVDGRPRQVIAADASAFVLEVTDLGALGSEARGEAVRAEATAATRTPFQLARGPLLRARLLRLGGEEHVLLVTVHHIVFDGWSMSVFVREVSALYEAFTQGKPSPLPDLPIQYADYAAWQRRWLTGEVLARELAFWRKHLDGAPRTLDLPTDRPRPAVQAFHGAEHSFEVLPASAQALATLGRHEGVTPFMSLLGLFSILLHRASRQEEVVIGTPIANRRYVETEGLIGFFVNTLALRTDLSGEPTFRELLRRVRATSLGALAHQDMPFERLVDELEPERDLSRSPVFQVMFLLQNNPTATLTLPGLTFRGLEGQGGGASAKFDLSVGFTEAPGKLRGDLVYNTDLFDAATIERMAGHLTTLLDGAVSDPEARIGALPLLTDAERRLLLEWNDTAAVHPDPPCLHTLIEEQVRRTPSRTAITFEDTSWSYETLNRKANQLAHRLRSMGVGPDARVGVCMDRSLELLAALLGVLKAGGAYVPIDPTYPAERVAFMLADARVPVLLTQEHRAAVAGSSSARTIVLDPELRAVAAEPAHDPAGGPGFPSPVSAENLAYVIYTSGSTGVPKGAMIPHRAIRNHMLWMKERFPLEETDAVLQKTPISFDASVWELFAPLLSGARLVLARPEGHKDAAYLASAIPANGVTILQLVPSMLQVLLDEPGFEHCRSLRRVFLGGEVVTVALQQRFMAKLPADLINLYGPTEVTIDATSWTCERDGHRTTVPIGRPIANLRAHVLDGQGRRTPIGVPGELHLGGDGLGRGYLNRPDLTAEKFIPDAYGGDGARLYRTGDLARFRADGTLEFLGRIDQQVKLRGYRIELGEIEALLGRHPSVREAVVLLREDRPGERRLCAYLVSVAEPAPSVADLRAFLAKALPDHMVPALFVFLERFPLTPSGKVDRRALPAPKGGRREPEDGYVAPRRPTEQVLAGIWASVLRIENVGLHDNFFALGGDSILSIQIVSRAAREGLRITPKQLFQHQTVEELAAVAEKAEAISAEQGPVTGAATLTPIQRWFFDRELADAHHWNQAVLLEAQASLDAARLQSAVARLLAQHDVLRTRFLRTEVGWRAVQRGADGPIPFTRVALAGLSEAEQRAAIEATAEDVQASLDLAEGRVVRVVLFDLGAPPAGAQATASPGASSRLLLVCHHLVVDGVSWRILLEDLWTAYEQLGRGEPIQLPAKTTSFKQWAERLSGFAQSGVPGGEVDYWLAEARLHSGRLPVDRPGGANTEASAQAVTVILSPEETRALLHEVPEAYRTQINDALLTALAEALLPWTGARSVLVDLEGHGREELFLDLDVTRTVGWFTTMFPVLLDLGASAGPGEALTTIKEQLRALPEGGIGYGLLRYLRADGDLAARLRAMPPADLTFNYLGQLDQALPENAGLRGASESSGRSHSARGRRSHLLDVTALVAGGRLRVSFLYSENLHERATLDALAQRYLEALRDLIAHCLSPDAGGFTASDFPLAQLSQREVEQLLGRSRDADEPGPSGGGRA